jgi:hypothetical protein
MHPLAIRAAAALLCALALLPGAGAQQSDPERCRQGVLALIVMIDAEEHDRSHYRNTARSVVESCGPALAPQTPPPAPLAFDKAACGKLALTMLEGIEATKMGSPEFAQARNAFAAQCRAN